MRGRRIDDVATAGLLLGVPVALWTVAGLPSIVVEPTGSHLIGWAVAAAWAAWAWCATGVLVDMGRMVRARDVSLGARRGALPRLAARLAGFVLAIGSLSSALPAGAAPTSPPTPAPNTITTAALDPGVRTPSSAPPTTVAPAATATWTVASGDCLWTIAERIEGDGESWTMLANANLGHVMTDGQIFTDPSLIYPGWVLVIPSSMVQTTSPPVPTAPSPLATEAPSIDAPLAEIPQAQAHAPVTDGRGRTEAIAAAGAHSFTDAAVVAGSVLGVGAVVLGLLRRRRARGDRRAERSEELLDAEVLLEQSASLPALSLTEVALLLAASDGVLTSSGLLSVGGDGARLSIDGRQVWHAAPIDLLEGAPALSAPQAALVPLGDHDGSSWSMVVPAGCIGAIGGADAEPFVAMALSLQCELAWGHEVLVIDADASLDALGAVHGGLLLATDPLLSDTRLAVVHASEDGCLVRCDADGIELVDLGLRLPRPGPSPLTSTVFDEPLHEGPPTTHRDEDVALLVAPLDGAAPGPMVRLLATEPRLDGLAQVIEPKRARRAVEVVAYIALHDPDPVTGDRIRTRVLGSSSRDAAAKTLFNVTSAARKGLGVDAEGHAILPIADRTGCYRLGASLTSDVAEFHAHLACARRSEGVDAQMAHLRAALELIEGEPLGSTLSGWDWFTVEGHRARLEAAVEEAAVWLVDLALHAGLAALAQLALDRARPVVPLSEALAAQAMEVAAANGSLSDLRRCFDELGTVLDELDPGCWPVVSHEERFSLLVDSLRRREGQASFAAMDAAPRSTSPSAPAAL